MKLFGSLTALYRVIFSNSGSGTTTLVPPATGTISLALPASSGTLRDTGTSIISTDFNDGAIARTKLAAGTAYRVVVNGSDGKLADNAALTNGYVVYVDANGLLASEATLAKSRGGAGADMSSVTFPTTGTVPVYTATTSSATFVQASGGYSQAAAFSISRTIETATSHGQVTMGIANFAGTATANGIIYTAAGVIPAGYRPASTMYVLVPVRNGSSAPAGLLGIKADGSLELYANETGGIFTSGNVSCGIRVATSVTWGI